MMTSGNNAVLVIGGGVAGAQVARQLTGSGVTVYLVEKTPSLGGITAQLGYMFSHHNCVLCRGSSDHGYGCTRPSISPDFLDFNQPDNLHVLTLSELVDLQGQPGEFVATLRSMPRYVDPALCINCHKCAEVCPVEVVDRYLPDHPTHKAAYKIDWRAIPNAYIIDQVAQCADCRKCQDVCPTGAIDLDESEKLTTIQIGAVVLATGYQLHDPTASAELGYRRVPNVLTGFEFERMASLGGPTEGQIARPSDGQPPRRIAWLQCVGSRDKDHDYCSAFCCMYATKQAVLAKQALPETECTVFFMDDRVFGKQFLDTYESMRAEYGIDYTRCRLFDVLPDKETGEVVFRYLADGQSLQEARFDMLVLSVGAEPVAEMEALARTLGIEINAHGFVQTEAIQPGLTSRAGVFACGNSAGPKDLCDTTIEAGGVVAQVLAFLRNDRFRAPRTDESVGSQTIQVEEPRTGVFICRCAGEIDGIIDVDGLINYAASLSGVVYAGAVDFGCFAEGYIEIVRAIDAYDLNRLVVGACTPRTHQPIFERMLRQTGNDPHLLEFVPLREFCTWPHRDRPVEAERKAHELMRRAIARVETLEAIPQDELSCQPAALVIGGGLSGLTAALYLAERGIPVHLVEKEAQLGGNFARIHYLPDGTQPAPYLADLLTRVQKHERISIYLGAEVIRSSGRAGDYRSVLCRRGNGQGPSEEDIRHGAIIVATGAREYRGGVFGLGQIDGVVTQLDLEDEIARDPEQVKSWRSVAMVSCVGVWNEEQGPRSIYPYTQNWRCSRNCCLQIMKNALRIKSLNPDCQVVVFYRETMTTAFFEELYTEARRQGVLFVRYAPDEAPKVEIDGGRVVVSSEDLSLGHRIELKPDRVALAVALQPNPDNVPLAALLNVNLDDTGFFEESEPKQRTTEFHRQGVYLCGLAHSSKISQLNIAQALTAAEQVAHLLAPGVVRTQPVVAVVDESHCMGCLTCVRVCPYGVPVIDPKREGKGGIMGASYIDPTNCQGCGTCPSECPGKAISLHYYRDEQVMIALGRWEA